MFDVSCELTWGKSSPALGVSFSLPLGILKSTVENRAPPELLLEVNVTFSLSGTTYPPGIGSASAYRVTVNEKRANICKSSMQCTGYYVMSTHFMCYFKSTRNMLYVHDLWHDVCGRVADKHKVKLSALSCNNIPPH